jgi:hypothetical protein
MVILKHGKFYNETGEGECFNCKCVVRVSRNKMASEIVEISNIKYRSFFVECPECGPENKIYFERFKTQLQ